MKKMIFILLLLSATLAKAQQIPQSLKDSAFKYYVELRLSLKNNTYEALYDRFYGYNKKCLSYCKSEKDSLAFSEWMFTKWKSYKKGNDLR